MAIIAITAKMKGGGHAMVCFPMELVWTPMQVGDRQPAKDELPKELATIEISTHEGVFHFEPIWDAKEPEQS